MDELEVIERLTRVETKLDNVIENQKKHDERHWQFNIRALIAVVSAGLAVIVSLFK